MKHKTWINVLIILGLLVSTGILNLASPPTARAETTATIRYVKPGINGDCSSWAQACPLYDAVTNATSGTEIWVASGTYRYQGGREISIPLKNGVAIYGGFVGTETSRDQRNPDPATNDTILSGDRGTQGDASDNRYHVVTASSTDSSAILDGFTITAGNADGADPFDKAGGMYINGGSPTLRNLIFSGNKTTGTGGGMYNLGGSPTLTNVEFSGNSASACGGGVSNSGNPALTNVEFSGNLASICGGGVVNSGNPALTNVSFSGNSASAGGGMYNSDGSPMLTNVTFSGNSADKGGGIRIVSGSPSVRNSILWNNQDIIGTGTITANIKIASGLITLTHSLVQGSGGSNGSWIGGSFVDGGNNLDSDPLFVEAINPAEAPTTSGDLRLQTTSPAIEAGDNQYVTGVSTDLDGNPRISCEQVDMGAYEVDSCFSCNYVAGKNNLAAGQEYRDGFHTTDEGTIQTIHDAYPGIGLMNFDLAEQAFNTALGCAATPKEKQAALTGLLDTHWELSTGSMLVGNEHMVQALDMRNNNELADQIERLEDAQAEFAGGVNTYLALMSSDLYEDILDLQPDRISPLDAEEDPLPKTPYLDIQRFAEAAAKHSRAVVELAERHFRQYTEKSKDQARTTLKEGYALATAELALLDHMVGGWGTAFDDPTFSNAYQILTENIANMRRLFSYLEEGKNPFGYYDGYVHFRIPYDNSTNPDERFNFLNVHVKAEEVFADAEAEYTTLIDIEREMDDDWYKMEEALTNLESNYEGRLVALCGAGGDLGNVVDLAGCDGGEIGDQVFKIQDAMLRVQKVQTEMASQLELIRIEQERVAKVVGIYNATALMYTETGEELSGYARAEVELQQSHETVDGVFGVLNAGLNGFTGGGGIGAKNFNPLSAIATGGISMILEAGKLIAHKVVNDKSDFNPADVAARREEIKAYQNAQVQIAQGEIEDANSEALIKQYMLEFATLKLDQATALNTLMQEIARLDGLKTEVEYLLARWAEQENVIKDRFTDPALRVIRDQQSEVVIAAFDEALEWGWKTSRALDYEIAEKWEASQDGMVADGVYGIVDTDTLENYLAAADKVYDDWLPTIPPAPAYTAIPLSKVLGYADSWEIVDGKRVFTTARDKFNRYVRDKTNWVDLDDNGTPESLQLVFQTSIFDAGEERNLFSTGVYNDKILRLAPVLIGDEQLLDGTSNNTSVRIKQLGTCYLRKKDAVIGGQDSFRAYDFEHAMEKEEEVVQEARLYSYHEWINAEDLDTGQIDDRGSLGLLWHSVGCTKWVLTIAKEGIDRENSDLDFAGLDDILLWIKHRNFALPTPSSMDQPILLDSVTRAASPYFLDNPDIAYRYSGTLISEQVEGRPSLPPIQFAMHLEESGGAVTGAVEADNMLGFPVLDPETGFGPGLSGTTVGHIFILSSETFDVGSGLTNQITFNTTQVISDGLTISGEFVKTISGMLQEPLQVRGTFTMTLVSSPPLAAFSAVPGSGAAPLSVEFTDWSQGDPTSWEWDFGDGFTSSEQNPTHTYTKKGIYTVRLTVANTFGTGTLVETETIAVSEPRLFLPVVMMKH